MRMLKRNMVYRLGEDKLYRPLAVALIGPSKPIWDFGIRGEKFRILAGDFGISLCLKLGF